MLGTKTLEGVAPPAQTNTRPSGHYRLAAGSHPRDRLATCPSCGEVCSQRYDATQVIDHYGQIAQGDQYTCQHCKQTYTINVIYRPDLTESDVLTILERREPSAGELRDRITIVDAFAELARKRGDYRLSTLRAREAFGLRRQLAKIEKAG